jgi:hypothetical protein
VLGREPGRAIRSLNSAWGKPVKGVPMNHSLSLVVAKKAGSEGAFAHS